jgi:hypothetical protein
LEEDMGWTILGISDEVETCEHCGRTNLKRTVCLTNGEGEMYVGTTCAATMLGRRKEWVARTAKERQRAQVRVQDQEEWSRILNSRHYNFLKNQIHALGEARNVDKIRMGFERVIEQSGVSPQGVIAHLKDRWGTAKVSCLEV